MKDLPVIIKRTLPALLLGVVALTVVTLVQAQDSAPTILPAQEPAMETQVEPVLDAQAEPVNPEVPPVSNLEEITESATVEEVAITAIPPRLGDDDSLRGDPGEAIQTQVRIRNNSGNPISVETIVEDFIIGEDGKTPIPVVAETNSLWSLAQWITLANPRNIVPAHDSITIPVIIQIPQDAKPGGRYAMIMHQPVDGGAATQTGEVAGRAAVSPRVGTLVYFRVNGDVTQNAAIRNINIPGLNEFGPVPISYEIENLSDIHIQPKTTVSIRNMLGQTVEQFEVDSRNIFPYTTRGFEAEWDRVWGFGRYTAEFAASYGDQGKVAMAQYSFWLIPYTLIMAVLIILLAMLGIFIAVRRHLEQRNSVENQHIDLLEDRIRQLEDELQKRD